MIGRQNRRCGKITTTYNAHPFSATTLDPVTGKIRIFHCFAFRDFFFRPSSRVFPIAFPESPSPSTPCRKVVQVLSDQHRSAFQQVATLSSDMSLGVFFVCCFFFAPSNNQTSNPRDPIITLSDDDWGV